MHAKKATFKVLPRRQCGCCGEWHFVGEPCEILEKNIQKHIINPGNKKRK